MLQMNFSCGKKRSVIEGREGRGGEREEEKVGEGRGWRGEGRGREGGYFMACEFVLS